MRAILFVALTGFALLAPAAEAQTGAVAAAAEPASGQAPPGGEARTNFTFSNPLDRDVNLTFSFSAGRDVKVEFKTWTATVPAHGGIAVPALVRVSPNATTGDVRVELLSQEVGNRNLSANAAFTLRIAGAPVLPSPLASPRPAAAQSARLASQDVNLTLGGEAVVHLTLENRGAAPWAPTLRFELPAGVSATPAFAPGTIPPGSIVDVPLLLRAQGASAGDVEAAVLASPAQPAPLRLHLAPAVAGAAASADAPTLAAPESRAVLVAAGAATLAGAGAFLSLRRRWPYVAAALYTRLLPNRARDQPTRERIAALVEAEPGIAFSDVARRLDLGFGALTYHAQVLERSGVVFSARDGQQRRFFPVAEGFVAGAGTLAERALARLREKGPTSAAELARELGVSRQALHYHLKRLTREGKVRAADGAIALA